MVRTDLGGHSGCLIYLYEEDDGKLFVRKISKNISYNERLIEQENKQRAYTNEKLKTPEIYGDGFTDDGLYFFDMEYINGITLAEYLKWIDVSDIKTIVGHLSKDIIDKNEYSCSPCIFLEKIESLEELLKDRDDIIVKEAIRKLKEYDWKSFKKSKCHGDLTLENIIIKNGEIYLIDFLDSFFDCWKLDVATMLQDALVMWAYRKEKMSDNTHIRLKIFRDLLIDHIVDDEDELMDLYYALLLKLVRILPYTDDMSTSIFLTAKIDYLLHCIERVRE